MIHKIDIVDASFGYSTGKGKKILLKNIRISAEQGETIALIGINGSGKSTFLKSMAKLLKTLSGDIFIDQKNIDAFSVREYAKISSFVSSEIVHHNWLNVYDLVALGRFPHQRISNSLTKHDEEVINKALEITETFRLKDSNINEISDGERQKVMIARALAQDTDIILLDEPTSFLDLSNKFSIYKLLSEIASGQNKTIIFSTHDLNIALKYADKIWLIKNERIYEGAPEDLLINNVFNDIFEKKIVYFNTETNEFSVRFEKRYPIHLIQHTQKENLIKLTESALIKKGFYTIDEKAKLSIQINNDNTWTVSNGESNYTEATMYKTIKHLLSYL